jgi:hypothetical protein
LGDLFVIRLAGNIPDDAVLGSLEYAAEHLGYIWPSCWVISVVARSMRQ